MDQAQSGSLIDKIRQHIDKILITASGLAILTGGYFTWDYKTYTDCQVRLLEANRATTTTFAESMRILLTQPPRPVEERRQAFTKLQAALDRQQAVQNEVGGCK